MAKDAEASSGYPIHFGVDDPDLQSRWKALLRLPLSIPALIFSSLLLGGAALAIWAAILVGGKIPTWLFEFQMAANRWQLRAASYLLLLTDQYPPLEGEHPIRYEVRYPERVSRWKLVFWKLITSIPHFFVIGVLSLTLVVVVPIAWFAILINARFPSSLHDYVSNVLGCWARVQGYVLSLTDDFPPFSLMARRPSRRPTAYLASSTVGVLAVSAFVGFFSLVAILSPGNVTVEVTYERLLSGEVRPGETLVQLESREDTFESVKTTGTFELTGAADPADALLPLLVVEPGHRFVQFELVMQNQTYLELESDQSSFGLEDAAGDTHRPILAIIGGRVHHDQHSAPWDLVDTSWEVEQGESATALIVFELLTGIDPVEFRFNIGHHVHRSVIYELR